MSHSSALSQPMRDIYDAFEDFRRTPFQSVPTVLGRVVQVLDAEPMTGFLNASLPPTDFDRWYLTAEGTVAGHAGSGRLDWPPDRRQRVALQIGLLRALAEHRVQLLDLGMKFFLTDTYVAGLPLKLWNQVFRPMLRDLERLIELREMPEPLSTALRVLPRSGEAILDRLLDDACTAFADSSPKRQREALEKLWDAWERLKSLHVPGDKKASTARLLDAASTEPKFRALLEAEARALTEIGNTFHIRHFETDRVDLPQAEHISYLFHRLLAFLHLLLARGGAP